MKGSFPAPNPDDEKAMEHSSSNPDAKSSKARYEIALVLFEELMPNIDQKPSIKDRQCVALFLSFEF